MSGTGSELKRGLMNWRNDPKSTMWNTIQKCVKSATGAKLQCDAQKQQKDDQQSRNSRETLFHVVVSCGINTTQQLDAVLHPKTVTKTKAKAHLSPGAKYEWGLYIHQQKNTVSLQYPSCGSVVNFGHCTTKNKMGSNKASL